MRGHGCGEWVSSVDDGVDALLSQPTPQAVNTTEPADAYRTDRQGRVRNPAGQRADDIDLRVQYLCESAAFSGAAQQQHAH
jgi:hypothetical protein